MKYIYPIIEWCVDHYWIFIFIGLIIGAIAFIEIASDCSDVNGVLVKGAFGYECIEKGLH